MKRALQALYEGLVIDRPVLTLLLLLLILGATATGVPKFRLDASADSLLLESDRTSSSSAISPSATTRATSCS